MADTIGIILEYLHRHHFSRAEAVLREEVSLRQQSNGPIPLPLNDDLDLDVAIYLKSMQEKSAQKHQAVPDKRAHDKLVTGVKPSASAGLEVKEEPRGQVGLLRPSTKLEEPEPLFMEFEVEQLEYPSKPKSVVGDVNSPSPVTLSPVSKKTTVERRRSPVRAAFFKLARLVVLNLSSLGGVTDRRFIASSMRRRCLKAGESVLV